MRELVWSRAQGGGRGDLERLILSALNQEQNILWLVPEPYSHETELRLAELGGAGACLRAEAVSFALLCERVLQTEGGLERPLLDEGGRLLTLRLALTSIPERLRLFRRALSRPAALTELMALVDECKLYCIRPADLESAAQTVQEGASERLAELGHILGAYEAACARSAMDSRDRSTLTAEKLRAGGYGEGFSVFVSDFHSFTPQERGLLFALADKAAALHIYLCGEPGDEAFRVTERTAAGLKRGLPDLKERLAQGEDSRFAPALRYLEKHWFYGDTAPYSAEHDALELWRCGSAAEECRLAAENIIGLCASGRRFREIHILYPEDEPYAPLLATIFPHYGIPLFMDKTDAAAQKPLFRCVRALLDCVLYGFRPADVLSLLRCGLSPFDDGEIDRLEDYLTLWSFRGKGFTARDFCKSPRGYGAEPDKGDEAALTLLNRMRRYIADALTRVENKKKTAAAHGQALYDALTALYIGQGLRMRRTRLEQAGYEKLALENEQLWEILMHGLEQCAGVLGDEALGLADYGDLLSLTLSGCTVGSIPATLDAVRAGSIGRFARVPAPVVLILGAAEDAMPAQGAGGGHWSEEERRALSALDVELPPDEFYRLEREELNLYTAFTLATDKLMVSYPSDKSVPLTEDSAAVCVKRAAELLNADPLPAPPPSYPVEQEAPLPPTPLLSALSAARLFRQTLTLTPSRVRVYQDCPFAYFLRYGLRLRERPRSGLDPRQVGSILHEILENTSRYIERLGGFRLAGAEETVAAALREAEACLARTLHAGQEASARVSAQGKRILQAARRLALCLWEELSESDFTPRAFELACESEALPLPEVPPGAPSRYLLRGTADRVDLCERDGELLVRVVDYKSGRTGFGFTELYNGVGAQLLQYLFLLKDGAARYFPTAQGEPVAAGLLYLPTKTERAAAKAKPNDLEREQIARQREKRDGLLLAEPEILRAMDNLYDSRETPLLPVNMTRDGTPDKRSKVVGREQMALLERFTKDLLYRTAEGIACGRFAPLPLDGGENDRPCLYCDGRAACGFSEDTDNTRPKIPMNRESFLTYLESGEIHGEEGAEI